MWTREDQEEGLQEAAIEIAHKFMAHGEDIPFIAGVEDEEWLKEDEHTRV